jgi:UrcA family protein
MSTKTRRVATIIHGTLLLGCLLIPVAALAEEPQAAVSRSARVSLADLDLSTAEGAQAARERIQATARRLCRQFIDPLDLDVHASFVACVDRAVAAALRQITPPTLARDAGPGTAPTHR